MNADEDGSVHNLFLYFILIDALHPLLVTVNRIETSTQSSKSIKMGRTKNPPKRKLDQVSVEPPSSVSVEPAPTVITEPVSQNHETNTDTNPSTDLPPKFVDIAIGPNRTISIQVKPRTKSMGKRRKKVDAVVEEQIEAAAAAAAAVTNPTQPLEVEDIIIQENSITEIRLCPRVALNPPDRWRLLHRVQLEQTQLILPEESRVTGDTYFIQTAKGSSVLLASLNFGNMDALGHAIEDGTVQLECQNDPSKITVSIYLTKKSLLVCSSETLAFGSLGKRNVAKKYMSAMHLYQTLAALFPDSVLVDIVQKTTGPPITAKMVYAKVDNVQLSHYEQQNLKPMEDIPGLVPTLRPYQQASVNWMLKRERGETVGNEWELAWVVLVGTRLLPLHQLQLKERDQAMLFISPFAGWMKETYDEARIATLGYDPVPVNGGILANSMGTGKTVEVIACILANPYMGFIDGKQAASAQVAERKDDHQHSSDASSQADPAREEVDQDEGPTICTPVKQRPGKAKFDFENDVSDDDENTREANKSLMNVEHLGVCMCGQAKLFKNGLSLVLCGSCDDPMHGVCAGFTSIEELLNETRAEWRGDSVCEKYTARICSESRCPTCVFSNRNKRLINSRATLIVTPPSILHQWEREIRRHTAIQPNIPQSMSPIVSPNKPNKRPLKVLVYPGIRELYRKKPGTLDESSGQLICHLMHPDKLADADVVLMTFESLMGDLCHTDENPFTDNSNQQGLRSRKRYRVNPSPLTSIKWWRICLDEAQRVDVPTATSARMALKLEAHFRWCVSGTPIGRGKLEDLYGLVLFLRLYPFAERQWFDQCLHSGHGGVMERVRFMFQDVMWRSTKASPSVRIQMGVPEQIEKKVMLKFSSIEKHFYERQLERTMVAASDVVGKSEGDAQRKGKTDVLALQLHRLRAACCHPQVGSSGLAKIGKKRKDGGVSIGSAVLSMDQILDRLIDDAKIQCEESQRIAVLHTNAMASLSRLKVEAKSRGDVTFSDSDKSLLAQSCRSYMESLEIAEANSKPTPLVGEAVVTGCRGCLCQRKIVRDGKAVIMWKIKVPGVELTNMPKLWARFDFEGPSKKITDARVRMLATVPTEFQDELSPNDVLLKPKTAAFQVAHSSLGGEFVDVVDFDFNADETDDNGWLSKGGFRTNKSKGWRLLLSSYGCDSDRSSHVTRDCGDSMHTLFVAVEIQMLEADVASDSLQRLHVLHNLSLSMSALSQVGGADSTPLLSITEMKKRMDSMHEESKRIESLYMDAANAPHRKTLTDLRHCSNERSKIEEEFLAISNFIRKKKDKIADLWQDLWWDDLLAICFVHGGYYDRERLCDIMHAAIDEFVADTLEGQKFRSRPIDQQRYKGFPNFQDVDGLRTGLGFRLAEYLSTLNGNTHTKTIDEVLVLSAQPSEMEIYENSRCGNCREDWNQTGPTCRHCHLEKRLKKIIPDHFILCVLKTLWKWLKDTKPSGNVRVALEEAKVFDRASLFFDLLKANETELQKARKAWTTHFDLLSDIDELNQCKRSMRLTQVGEDLTKLSDDELNAIVAPWDIASRHLDHSTKQAMALANLRRNTQTLRYLRHQSLERQAEEERKKTGTLKEEDQNTCCVCLSTFCGERAVLACGHSFHHSPCMEMLIARAPGNGVVTCPLRCTKKTKREEVLIATDRRNDDGSKGTRTIEGSFGTKVTRLLGDLMDVAELGDKSIVFSQWEDMLDVVEHALAANGVSYARVKTMARLGDTIKQFRSHECFVLLLNVKNGAEGITLVEATHVFMIEPLLNCGLDSQAIARVNRIGQTSKTYVHRYLIEGTIEVKIDNIRVEREEDQLEDSISETKKEHDISAGGIDGGFTEAELQDILK